MPNRSTHTLTYPSDVQHIVNQVVGPATDGRLFVATSADLGDDGKTRVTFRPLTAQELADAGDAGRVQAIAG